MKTILNALVLPKEVTAFEESYLQRLNRIAKWFFVAHLPIFMAVAWACDTGPLMALGLTALALSVPLLSEVALKNPRHVSLSHGFSSMIFGGLLVHFGQGPVQIEMHFYFFASLAMLAVFGNPLVILVAAITVAVHHGLLWWYLPASVFNYDAPFWVVAVHAGFVVLESVATCFIARSFFDNVIGLEKIVQARTQALDQRNQEMRMVMDHVGQGFLTVKRDGTMAKERSRIVGTFLGEARSEDSFEDYVSRVAPSFATSFAFGFEQLLDGFLPIEVCVGQLPTRFEVGESYFAVEYTPIIRQGEFSQLLVVLSDVTADVERARYEAESKEVMGIFERVMKDKIGFLEFFEEATTQVENICEDRLQETDLLKRALHTLKGNALIFGIKSVGELCHSMEDVMVQEGLRPSQDARHELRIRWSHLKRNLDTLIGERQDKVIEVADREYQETLHWLMSDGMTKEQIAERVSKWKMEHTRTRLERIAEQTRAIARRLNKGEVDVAIEDSDLLLEPEHWASFWASFIHVVRNAIDHGIESPEERTEQGKQERSEIKLLTRTEEEEFVISLQDDGRGIDWDRVSQKATLLGLPVANQNDLVEALFAEGVSTKEEVTEFSGRGVGMAAVRQECNLRGGHILVNSTPGTGTTVEFRFPRSEMARTA